MRERSERGTVREPSEAGAAAWYWEDRHNCTVGSQEPASWVTELWAGSNVSCQCYKMQAQGNRVAQAGKCSLRLSVRPLACGQLACRWGSSQRARRSSARPAAPPAHRSPARSPVTGCGLRGCVRACEWAGVWWVGVGGRLAPTATSCWLSACVPDQTRHPPGTPSSSGSTALAGRPH